MALMRIALARPERRPLPATFLHQPPVLRPRALAARDHPVEALVIESNGRGWIRHLSMNRIGLPVPAEPTERRLGIAECFALPIVVVGHDFGIAVAVQPVF